jgi:glycosyltransferase involved in cell wall biosynthesis
LEIRVLALLEATSITGTAKAVLEYGREASAMPAGGPKTDLSVAIFARRGQPPGEVLTAALMEASIRFHIVRERGRFDWFVVPQLRNIIAQERPDILWSHSVKSHFLVSASKLNAGRKWVAYHHGYTTTNLKMRAYNQLDRWSLRRADRVMTVCQPFAKQMLRRGVKQERIRIQKMPIRPFQIDASKRDSLREALGLTELDRVLLTVGRLSHEKGHIELVRALASMREHDNRSRLVLVGDGPERVRLERECRALGLSNAVIFAGHQNDVKPFYGMADVFVLPSYSEGSPNVLLEAMAARVPVVATAVGGVPELAHNDTSALLLRPGDPGALAEAIVRIQRDQQLRERLTEAAYEVVKQHSPEGYYRALSEMFGELMEERAAG